MSTLKTCPHCGLQSPDIFLYCFDCGARMDIPGRRSVSVFFPVLGALLILFSSFYKMGLAGHAAGLSPWKQARPIVLILLGICLLAVPNRKWGAAVLALALAVLL